MTSMPSLPRIALGKPSATQKRDSIWPWMPPAALIRLALFFRRFLLRLADAIVPASLPMFEQSTGMMQTMMLTIVSRHEIADRLKERPLTAAELARMSGTNADVLHRILRALASRGVFTLDKVGRFHNNRLSKSLLTGEAAASREWVQYFGSQSNVLAWADLQRSVVDGQSSFDRVFGMSVWDWFEKHSDEQDMFAHSMMGVTAIQAPIVARLYPFRELKTICDIGGGRGTLLSGILAEHPQLQGLLYDAAGVLESADALLKARGLRDRVASVEGNFFKQVPSGADAYLLKNIFHDWDDAHCSLILKNLATAMQPGQKILVIEQLVEQNDARGFGPASDVQMLVACTNGRERSRDEIQKLFLANGLRLGRTFSHPLISIVEAVV